METCVRGLTKWLSIPKKKKKRIMDGLRPALFNFFRLGLEEKKGCGERGSNTRPSDLQSDALPTELSPHVLKGSQYLDILLKYSNIHP